jgi:hypothetical protein
MVVLGFEPEDQKFLPIFFKPFGVFDIPTRIREPLGFQILQIGVLLDVHSAFLSLVTLPYGCARKPAAASRTAWNAALPFEQSPPAAGAERRGDCLSRMGLREAGHSRCKEIGSLATFSGEPIFCGVFFDVDRKIGGTENPCGDPLQPGRFARCAKEEGSRRGPDARDRRPGEFY